MIVHAMEELSMKRFQYRRGAHQNSYRHINSRRVAKQLEDVRKHCGTGLDLMLRVQDL